MKRCSHSDIRWTIQNTKPEATVQFRHHHVYQTTGAKEEIMTRTGEDEANLMETIHTGNMIMDKVVGMVTMVTEEVIKEIITIIEGDMETEGRTDTIHTTKEDRTVFSYKLDCLGRSIHHLQYKLLHFFNIK